MLWESEVAGARRDTPERLAKIQARLLEHTGTIADRHVRFEFETLFKARCNPWEMRRRGKQPAAATAMREGTPPPPRPSARVQREILFRILIDYPELIDEVAESFAALEIPEPGLDKLRRELLGVTPLPPGLDAPALRQHLVQNGFAATVDALFSPSVDTGFLARRSDPSFARGEWEHVVGMLTREEPSLVAVSGNDPIGELGSAPDSVPAAIPARANDARPV
jgi:DNA primase